MTKIDIDPLHYDMSTQGGRIKRSRNSEAIAQNVRERLLTIQQEWFLDLDQGLPWFSKLTGHHVDRTTLKGYIAASVINTPGVTTVKSVEIHPPDINRHTGIEVTYKDKYGRVQQRSI